MASLVFLAFFLPISFISVLSNGLLLFFLGIIVHLLAAIAEDSSRWGGLKKSFLVSLLLGASLLTHNSTVIYIVATLSSFCSPCRPR